MIDASTKKELNRMLDSLNGYGQRPSYQRKAEPREVRNARKIIQLWDRAERHREEKFNARWDKAVARARREIYFGTQKSALALIDKLAK